MTIRPFDRETDLWHESDIDELDLVELILPSAWIHFIHFNDMENITQEEIDIIRQLMQEVGAVSCIDSYPYGFTHNHSATKFGVPSTDCEVFQYITF